VAMNNTVFCAFVFVHADASAHPYLQDGDTLLHYACRNQKVAIFRLLLKARDAAESLVMQDAVCIHVCMHTCMSVCVCV
jgi:hypothetical protein